MLSSQPLEESGRFEANGLGQQESDYVGSMQTIPPTTEPMIPEMVFNHRVSNATLDDISPVQEEEGQKSPLLLCSKCNVCVHASMYPRCRDSMHLAVPHAELSLLQAVMGLILVKLTQVNGCVLGVLSMLSKL